MDRKPTPEQLLRQVESEERFQSRGRLKIFLGYASGVGKSFKMIDEGRRRRERGQDVVVGALQHVVNHDVQTALQGIENIPLKQIGDVLQMDVQAIVARLPKVCLVDGLAYDNGPGSEHARRWQDVEDLLAAGISVISSLNIQHVEEKQAEVEAVTGKHVSQTVPLSFIEMADEIEIVDASPESCMRLDSKDGAAEKRKRLSELREITLLLVADVVDKQLEQYLQRYGIQQLWGTQERILVCLSPRVDAVRMLESASRNRDRFHGELIAVDINRPEWSADEKQQVRSHLALARSKKAEIISLDSSDVVEGLLRVARQRGITQIYVGHKNRESLRERAFGSELDHLIRSAEGMDVRVFPHQ